MARAWTEVREEHSDRVLVQQPQAARNTYVVNKNFMRSAPSVTACSYAQRIDKENKLAEKFWSEHAGLKGTQSLDSSPRHHRPRHEYAESVAATSAAPTGYTSKSTVRRCMCTDDKNAVGRAMQVVTLSLLCLPCALVQYLRDRLDKLERELQQEKQYRVKVRAGRPPCFGLVPVFCLCPWGMQA